MYALWQAINYETDFESQSTEKTRLPQTSMTDTVDTTLRPFYNSPTKIWTSSMVQKSGNEKPT